MVWKFLVRKWMHDIAADKVREAFGDAAARRRQAAGEEAEGDEPETALNCDIGIVAGRGAVAGAIVDLLDDTVTIYGEGFTAVQGALEKTTVAVVQAGLAATAAARAAEALLAGHRPACVLAVGFAAALSDKLVKNEILLANHVVCTDGRQFKIDFAMDREAVQSQPALCMGKLLSVDDLPRDLDERKTLAAQHKALAADGESFAVLEVCSRAKVPAMVVRIIHEDFNEKLPADVKGTLAQGTTAGKLGAATAALFRRPSAAKDLWKIKENEIATADRLARFVKSMVKQFAEAETNHQVPGGMLTSHEPNEPERKNAKDGETQ